MTGSQASLHLTREKLIECAGQVFAERGFQEATVREICTRAGTNIAAVNYHFGDKLGLYTEVLKSSIFAQQAAALNSTMAHPSDPQAAVSALIHVWCERSREGGRPTWFPRIMAHEIAHPTPALDVVAQAMGANYLRFRTLVGKLIGRGPNDPRTRMCVHSIVGQIVHYMQAGPMIARLWPDLDLSDEKQRRAIADHIVMFSLAGIENIARERSELPNKQHGGVGG
jgi:TetR/AcrR family transcriptional regulator, regulator of cefoperazone and chloramphenicol sensitivity